MSRITRSAPVRALRRGVRRLLRPAPLVVAGVVCLSLVGSDVLAGSWVERRVGARLGCRLGADTGVQVDVSGWPRSLALVTGTVPQVHVSAPDAQLTAQLTGDLAIDLHDVRRTDDGLSTGGGEARLVVPWRSVEERLDRPGVELTGADGAVVAEVDTGLVPVGLVARPEVSDGRLTLEPTAVRVGGRELTGALADRLLARVGSGDLVGSAVDLPTAEGLTLTSARGASQGLELTLGVAPGPLGAGLGGGRCR